ncbi:MAG: hypothetical protein ALECFALPRED_000713 [Alectoria fallacina]|uniref:CENP-V/GFA domain-containing protein n=1 Tax=Alectoria fallacina TaxID=1903189 RepID=A0A8H3PL84_9LECA|nr:MAG: hypothetical protein ALECFALPRED_000713 [Alectoria fallacina]
MLPDHPLVLHGGCNCRAIRYKVQVPARSQRPLNPFSDGQVPFPMVTTDHCNDCRRATGSILPTWICVPTSMMTCQLQPVSSSSSSSSTNQDARRGDDAAAPPSSPWVPAVELFKPGPDKDKYHVQFYQSSADITRTFCGRCGTNLTYFMTHGMGEGYPEIFDTILGTLDREDLEKDWMAPDRHCWWSCGIEWVQQLSNGGTVLPVHPTFKVNEFVE